MSDRRAAVEAVADPPDEPGDGWRDYNVPLMAAGGVVVRARSAEDALAYAETLRVSEVDLELQFDVNHLENVDEYTAWRDPINVGDDPDDISIPSVPSARDFAAARKRLGLTQSDVASRLGVARSTVSGWESGGAGMGLDDAGRYAHVLRREAYHG